MPDLKIYEEAVLNAANRVKALNDQMRDGFQSVKKAVSQLDSSWDGQAANHCIGKFREIEVQNLDNRYKVMDNYANFLLHQIGEGYAQTEQTNKSLADAFK